MTSKIEFFNSLIQSVAKKLKSLLKPLFNGVLVLIYYFEKYFKPCFFILKAFCSTLNSRIGVLENSIFDVTNRAQLLIFFQNFIQQFLFSFFFIIFHPTNDGVVAVFQAFDALPKAGLNV